MTNIRETLRKTSAQIESWEREYVLRSPIDGIVSFYEFWSNEQFVPAGKEVFVVAPVSHQLIARMEVAHSGTGKIRISDDVRIKLNDYPYKEYGVVSGKVTSVSHVARKGKHLVIASLEFPLVSSFKKSIPFKQDMVGKASIVTEDLRLIERIFHELRKIFIQTGM